MQRLILISAILSIFAYFFFFFVEILQLSIFNLAEFVAFQVRVERLKNRWKLNFAIL